MTVSTEVNAQGTSSGAKPISWSGIRYMITEVRSLPTKLCSLDGGGALESHSPKIMLTYYGMISF